MQKLGSQTAKTKREGRQWLAPLVLAALCAVSSFGYEVSESQRTSDSLPKSMVPQLSLLTPTLNQVSASTPGTTAVEFSLPKGPLSSSSSPSTSEKSTSSTPESTKKSTAEETREEASKAQEPETKTAARSAEPKSTPQVSAPTAPQANTQVSPSSPERKVSAPVTPPQAPLSLPIDSTANADLMRKRNARIDSTSTRLPGLNNPSPNDKDKDKKDAKDPLKKDEKRKEDPTPIDRKAANQARFGGTNEFSLNSIASNSNSDADEDPIKELSDRFQKKDNKPVDKTAEEKAQEEAEKKKLTDRLQEIQNKPPPLTFADYKEMRDLIRKQEELVRGMDVDKPLLKRATELFDQFASRDGESAAKQPYEDFLSRAKAGQSSVFRNPISVDPIPTTNPALPIHQGSLQAL